MERKPAVVTVEVYKPTLSSGSYLIHIYEGRMVLWNMLKLMRIRMTTLQTYSVKLIRGDVSNEDSEICDEPYSLLFDFSDE